MIPEAPEVRTISTSKYEFRTAEVEGRTMVGLVAPYNTVNDIGPFTEPLKPGVFAKSIREAARNLPLHVMHRHNEIPVGMAVRWEEATEGLLGEFRFDTRADAQEAARLAEEGFLGALSVGFLPLPDGSTWDLDGPKPHVDRIQARMLETSLCSIPALEGSRVLAMRSAGIPEKPTTVIVPTPRLAEAKAWLESLKR
jgi:HK97 family phage prohead protease